jgi:hypothetical protein
MCAKGELRTRGSGRGPGAARPGTRPGDVSRPGRWTVHTHRSCSGRSVPGSSVSSELALRRRHDEVNACGPSRRLEALRCGGAVATTGGAEDRPKPLDALRERAAGAEEAQPPPTPSVTMPVPPQVGHSPPPARPLPAQSGHWSSPAGGCSGGTSSPGARSSRSGRSMAAYSPKEPPCSRRRHDDRMAYAQWSSGAPEAPRQGSNWVPI